MKNKKFNAPDNFDAVLMIDKTDTNMDMYYLTRFYAPDPFALIVTKRKKLIITSELEFERAKKEAAVNHIILIKKYNKPTDNKKIPFLLRTIIDYFNKNNIHNVLVPSKFPVKYADILRNEGFSISCPDGSLVHQREFKTDEEIEYIKKAVWETESVLEEAIGIIKKASVTDGVMIINGEPLTSEILRKFIITRLISKGYLALTTIVAGGIQSADPHQRGSGVLRANEPIVLDVFPQSMDNLYFADMTRTVSKGEPHPYVVKMYEAVKEAQQSACDNVKSGVSAGKIHKIVCGTLIKHGFETGFIDGAHQGFIHSTGHGVGLEIHEEPRIYDTEEKLKENQVVTIEPGLYYKNYGGVRIEDLLVVGKKSALNLNTFEKKLVI